MSNNQLCIATTVLAITLFLITLLAQTQMITKSKCSRKYSMTSYHKAAAQYLINTKIFMLKQNNLA